MGNFIEGTVGKLVMSFLALVIAVFFAKVASVVLFGIAGGVFWMALVVYFLIGWFSLRASTYIVTRADGLLVFAMFVLCLIGMFYGTLAGMLAAIAGACVAYGLPVFSTKK